MTGGFLLKLLIFVVLIVSVVMHELSHGAVADAHGDPTPRLAGRLTWNPLAHLDPIGTIFIILIVFMGFPFFGWAKPVPINPAYFRDYRRGMIAVSIAGPFANFSLMVLCMGILYFMYRFGASAKTTFAAVLAVGVLINFILMFFNLLPIPPLDGSKVLAQFLSWKQQMSYLRMEALGFIILIALLFTGVLSTLLIYAFGGFTWVTKSLFGINFAVFIAQADPTGMMGYALARFFS
jgi:Zn-dependent protease